jgi:hypothetical protein
MRSHEVRGRPVWKNPKQGVLGLARYELLVLLLIQAADFCGLGMTGTDWLPWMKEQCQQRLKNQLKGSMGSIPTGGSAEEGGRILSEEGRQADDLGDEDQGLERLKGTPRALHKTEADKQEAEGFHTCQEGRVGPKRSLSQPTIFKYQMCIGVMLEMRKGGLKDSPEDAFRHPPNQTGWKHVQRYGSEDERHVSGDEGHSCLHLFQLTRHKWSSHYEKKCFIMIFPVQ